MRPIYFFGRLSGLAANGPANVTDSAAFRDELSRSMPELADPRVRMAVNQVLVVTPVPIRPEDEIAFLPPMSGG